MRAYFNSGGLWKRPRQPGQTVLQYQMRNWYYFTWLSGGVSSSSTSTTWTCATGSPRAHPVEAPGMGGRQVNVGKEFGEIYDHLAVDYAYPRRREIVSYSARSPAAGARLRTRPGTGAAPPWRATAQPCSTVEGQKPVRWGLAATATRWKWTTCSPAVLLAGKAYNEADSAAEGPDDRHPGPHWPPTTARSSPGTTR